MENTDRRGRFGLALGIALAWLLACPCAEALDPALDVSQYAHTAWKIRDGFPKGGIFAIAQTPDGISGWAPNSGCFGSMVFAWFRGSRQLACISLPTTS